MIDHHTIQPQPRFLCDGEEYTLAEMLDANADDPEVCDWLRTIGVGATFPAVVNVQRVA